MVVTADMPSLAAVGSMAAPADSTAALLVVGFMAAAVASTVVAAVEDSTAAVEDIAKAKLSSLRAGSRCCRPFCVAAFGGKPIWSQASLPHATQV
jgi:hypothetical protein